GMKMSTSPSPRNSLPSFDASSLSFIATSHRVLPGPRVLLQLRLDEDNCNDRSGKCERGRDCIRGDAKSRGWRCPRDRCGLDWSTRKSPRLEFRAPPRDAYIRNR